jgi:hypothetical protein
VDYFVPAVQMLLVLALVIILLLVVLNAVGVL